MIFVVFNYIIRNDTRVLILERVLIGKGGQTEREREEILVNKMSYLNGKKHYY